MAGGRKVSKCLSWQGSIFLHAMVKVDQVRCVRLLSLSCVYVVTANSWWEIGKMIVYKILS